MSNQIKIAEKIIEQITDAVNNGISNIEESLHNAEDGKANFGISLKLSLVKERVYVTTILRGSSKWDVEVPEDSVDISETLPLPGVDEEARSFHRLMKKHGATVTVRTGGGSVSSGQAAEILKVSGGKINPKEDVK